MSRTMVKTHYGCSGSCGGEITEEQFLAGRKICNDKYCDRYGLPLERMKYCQACDEHYLPESEEDHSACVTV